MCQNRSNPFCLVGITCVFHCHKNTVQGKNAEKISKTHFPKQILNSKHFSFLLKIMLLKIIKLCSLMYIQFYIISNAEIFFTALAYVHTRRKKPLSLFKQFFIVLFLCVSTIQDQWDYVSFKFMKICMNLRENRYQHCGYKNHSTQVIGA